MKVRELASLVIMGFMVFSWFMIEANQVASDNQKEVEVRSTDTRGDGD